MPTIIELGQKVKAKHPEYKDMDDATVGAKVKAKYPTEYADFTDTPVQAPQKKGFLEGASNTLNDIFGGKQIGGAIGTYIAKENAKMKGLDPNLVEKGPTAGQVVGDVGRVALNFVPSAKGLGTALGVTNKIARPALNLAGNAALGYGGDVTMKAAEGKENIMTPGIGTGIGAGLGALPIVGNVARKLGTEAIGLTTGKGGAAVNKFLSSIEEGGEAASGARAGMRGKISEEELVNEARGGIGQMISNRTADYQKQLGKLKTKTNEVSHLPIIEKFNKMLSDFGVTVNPNGTANFSRAPGLQRYEKELKNLSKTLSEWGTQEGDNTILGLDKLKQVIDDSRIGSADSKKFDAFVTAMRNEAKNSIRDTLRKGKDFKSLATYEKMVGNYEKSTREIREIQKALSLGDKASVDTAFRKLSSVLRGNNEIRKQAVQELDQITGGQLLPKIAGQQMQDLLPSGLVSRAGAVGTGIAGGLSVVPLLKLAVFSPRIMGELLNAIGIVGNKASLVKNELRKLSQQGVLAGASQNQ